MEPRGYQKTAVDACWDALDKKGNTILVAGTGAGKTIMSGFVVYQGMTKRNIKRVLWLQHRDKLTTQNCETFVKIAGRNIPVSIFDAETKSISGDIIFGMIQTVGNYIDHLPKFDMVVIDEAHHAPSSTYMKVVKKIKDKNPDVLLFGMTATPVRSDKKTMRAMFDNVAHIIPIPELIINKFLVPPVTFKPFIEGLKDDLKNLNVMSNGENDMDDVAAVIDKSVVNREVVRHWKEKASKRKTIVFCSNVGHCEHVAQEFAWAGFKVSMSHSKMKKAERLRQEKLFEDDKTQILVNVMIATEGFDDQRIGCVIILRTCGSELTFIQIAGRGLRLLDTERFPGWVKEDCIILDFATAHQSLEQDIERALVIRKKAKRASPTMLKVCPTCLAAIPSASLTCAFCGHKFPVPNGKEDVEDVVMREIDLLEGSRFSWLDVFANGRVSMASGFSAFVIVLKPWGDRPDWLAFAKSKGENLEIIGTGDRADALALANGWLRERDKSPKSRKGNRWMTDQPTDRQEWMLSGGPWGKRWKPVSPMGRYAAACRVNYQSTEGQIIDKVNELNEQNDRNSNLEDGHEK